MKKKTKEEPALEEKRMTEKDQDVLIKKIQMIVEKEIGSNFGFKTQGSNKSKMLVISGDQKTRITEVANLVAKDLKIKEHDCKKKHGSGMKRTVLILIPTVSEESVSLINKRHKLLLKKYGVKTGRKFEIPPVPVEEVKVEVPVQAEEMVASPKKRKQFDEKYVVSRYLSSVLRFEGLSFGELKYTDKSRDSFTIHCKEERTAEIIEKALLYYIGDQNSVVTSDSFDVLADLSKRVGTKNTKVFCMMPGEDSTIEEVEKRLLRVCSGSHPVVTTLESNLFKVSYSRAKTLADVFFAINKMSWMTMGFGDDSFLLYTNKGEFEKANKKILDDFSKPVVEKNLDVETENKAVFPVVNTPDFLKTSLFSKEEALGLLKRLKSDAYCLSRLSKETQQEIERALMEEWAKEEPEEYAKFLLSVLR